MAIRTNWTSAKELENGSKDFDKIISKFKRETITSKNFRDLFLENNLIKPNKDFLERLETGINALGE